MNKMESFHDDINQLSANAVVVHSDDSDEPSHLGFRQPISEPPIIVNDDTVDVTLAQTFQNVGLLGSDDVVRTDLNAHPLRPYAGDCSFYLRTGNCKYGLNCRYNHPPVNPSNQVGKEEVVVVVDQRTTADNKGFLPQMPEQIECKFYLTSGGCVYGDSCRYRHSKIMTEVTPFELNFIGLPIRLGAKLCTFYVRNGTCGYGPRCKFTHPNPTTTGGGVFEPHNNLSSAGLFIAPPVNGASQQAGRAIWSLPMMTGTDIALQRNNLPYLPAMPTLPHFTPAWNGFKAPEECALTRSSAPVETSHITKPDNSDGVQEYPERPGQPECVYFTKTGSCKFKSACRYHHPSTGTVTPVEVECVTTSENGLPLRPGKKVCRHYEQYGICKYGRACLFDHPVDLCFSPIYLTNFH